MWWKCPVCQATIAHDQLRLPIPRQLYNCPNCRTLLRFNPARGQMEVVTPESSVTRSAQMVVRFQPADPLLVRAEQAIALRLIVTDKLLTSHSKTLRLTRQSLDLRRQLGDTVERLTPP